MKIEPDLVSINLTAQYPVANIPFLLSCGKYFFLTHPLGEGWSEGFI